MEDSRHQCHPAAVARSLAPLLVMESPILRHRPPEPMLQTRGERAPNSQTRYLPFYSQKFPWHINVACDGCRLFKVFLRPTRFVASSVNSSKPETAPDHLRTLPNVGRKDKAFLQRLNRRLRDADFSLGFTAKP